MSMPFEKLMEFVSSIIDNERSYSLTMGDLSKMTGEPPERIVDAIDAVRVLRGERTCL